MYFSKFPLVSYNGIPARNIMARVAFDENTKNDSVNFMPVRISDDATRADVIADRYYGSSDNDWLVYLSNSVIDPYNDVPKSEEDFRKHITAKYGSTQFAREKILFYINNWADHTNDILSVTQYATASQVVKKFWTASTNALNQIIEYRRHKQDWIKSTNKLRILSLDSVAYLFVGAIVVQYVSGSIVAKGEIVDVNTDDNKITVQHITGTFVSTTNTLKRYNTSSVYVVSEVTNPFTTDNIIAEETDYWTTMTAYDYEEELNETKRNMILLRASLRGRVEDQITNLMKF